MIHLGVSIVIGTVGPVRVSASLQRDARHCLLFTSQDGAGGTTIFMTRTYGQLLKVIVELLMMRTDDCKQFRW